MKIVENLNEWHDHFQTGWLKEYHDTGKINWDLYAYAKNEHIPKSKGISLSKSKILFISSAGGYLPAKDKPFDADNPLGDYTIRIFPITSSFDEIDYAHKHYDQTVVRQDAQVLLPFFHLHEMVKNKIIGGLCNSVVSFMGYQPDMYKVVTETIPTVLKIVKAEEADAVILVPS